jgi:hypothetical protein
LEETRSFIRELPSKETRKTAGEGQREKAVASEKMVVKDKESMPCGGAAGSEVAIT